MLIKINKFLVIDATSKIASGLLSGNLNQLGDFDECLEAELDNFHGQYCLAEVQLKFNENFKLGKNILLKDAFRSNLHDVKMKPFIYFILIQLI